MEKTIETDIAIFGGGIAGLWLLNRVRQLGYSALLFESNTIGGGQTGKSQGIIHGGMKYALKGALTSAANAITGMPAVWKKCLQGQGDIDLSPVPILSSQQFLWSTGSITGKIAGFAAGMALSSATKKLRKDAFPSIFKHSAFKGQVYSLDEIIIDIPALLYVLMKSQEEFIFKIDALREDNLTMDGDHLSYPTIADIKIKAQKYIFTAGSGNELLLKKWGPSRLNMQRRPLHMVIVKHEFTDPVYAHCLGTKSVPRITISTHRAQDGKTIWYLGGQIAEEGVKRTTTEQIHFAKKELQELFPWLDFNNAQFASFLIDRAEKAEPNGARPDSCFMQESGNMIVAWPTKLAFTPLLSDQIISCLTPLKKTGIQMIPPLPKAKLSIPIWDTLLC